MFVIVVVVFVLVTVFFKQALPVIFPTSLPPSSSITEPEKVGIKLE
jgi:hypothetical protein